MVSDRNGKVRHGIAKAGHGMFMNRFGKVRPCLVLSSSAKEAQGTAGDSTGIAKRRIALVLRREVLLSKGDDVTGYAMALLGNVAQRLRGEIRSYGTA